MKGLILVGFVATVLFAVGEANICQSNDDCGPRRCCVKAFLFSYCQKRKVEGQHCIADIEDTNNEDKYLFTCPCDEGLECKSEGGEDQGFAKFFKDKCVKASEE